MHRRRRSRRPDRRAVAGSVAVHAVLIIGMILLSARARAAPPVFEVYRVDLVSEPPREAGEPEPVVAAEQPRVETLDAVETPPEPEPEPDPQPEPEQTEAPPEVERPETPKPAAEPPEEPDDEEPPAASGAEPDPESEEPGEGLNVQIEGEAFAYPGYLENIIRQINRFFRWTGRSGLEAEVYFVIRRDGSVEDIRILSGSGDISFNFQAMAAIEQAGNRQAFGPLPEGFEGERLPVSFYFRPAR